MSDKSKEPTPLSWRLYYPFEYRTGGMGCALQYALSFNLLKELRDHRRFGKKVLSDEDWGSVFKETVRESIEDLYENNAERLEKMTSLQVLYGFDVAFEGFCSSTFYTKKESAKKRECQTYLDHCRVWGASTKPLDFIMEDKTIWL